MFERTGTAMAKSITKTLLHLEERLLTPSVRKSPAELARLLAEDFREIGRDGKLYSKQQIISMLSDESESERRITEFETVLLTPDIILATYRFASRAPEQNRPVLSLRSSIWRRHGPGWRMVFHQGTPVG